MENKTFSREDFNKLLKLKSKYKIPFYRYKFDLKEIGTDNDFVDLSEILNFLIQMRTDYEYGKNMDDEDIDYIEQMIKKINEIVIIKVQD